MPPATPSVAAATSATVRADLAVVGGGVVGMSCAWAAAEAGMSVALVDPSPGSGASGVAAGMLAPATESQFTEAELSKANVASLAMWPLFAERLERRSRSEVGLRTEGTLVVAAGPPDRPVVEQARTFLAETGFAVIRLSSRELRAMEPSLSSAAGAFAVPGDLQVDNRALLSALQAALAESGVVTVRSKVAALEWRDGAVVGATTLGGTSVEAATVLLAAGAWSTGIGQLPAPLPLRPVKGHILRLEGDPAKPLLSHTVRAVVSGRACYLVPRADGSVVVGATMEDRGFDGRLMAGAVGDLLEDARTLVPALGETALAEASVGFRPGSPDNAPLVGRWHADGLLVACGHHRNGILLAPLTADAILATLEGSEPPPAAAAFDPSRPAVAAVRRKVASPPPSPVAGAGRNTDREMSVG
ncbi:MAG: glycine oxidase ThiO [Actinomycetota bacterium]|nr:glycine oxidase ThiO [Actinomycetota bacterium]